MRKKGKARKLEWERGSQRRAEKADKGADRAKVRIRLDLIDRSGLLKLLDDINKECESKTSKALPRPLLYSILFGEDAERKQESRNGIGLTRLRDFIADYWVFCQPDFTFDDKEYRTDNVYSRNEKRR